MRLSSASGMPSSKEILSCVTYFGTWLFITSSFAPRVSTSQPGSSSCKRRCWTPPQPLLTSVPAASVSERSVVGVIGGGPDQRRPFLSLQHSRVPTDFNQVNHLIQMEWND